MKKQAARRWASDKIIFIASGLFLLLTVVVLVFSLTQDDDPKPISSPVIQATEAQSITLEPQVLANLTAIPQGLVQSEILPSDLTLLQERVAQCSEYSPERRSQMNQHLTWLQDTSQIPPEMLVAFGANPTGKLIFGMATYTSIEWRLKTRPADSCLLPIGRTLNTLLLAAGEAPFSEFDPQP